MTEPDEEEEDYTFEVFLGEYACERTTTNHRVYFVIGGRHIPFYVPKSELDEEKPKTVKVYIRW